MEFSYFYFRKKKQNYLICYILFQKSLCTSYICILAPTLSLDMKTNFKVDYDMDFGNFYDNNLLKTRFYKVWYKVMYYYIGVSNEILEGILSSSGLII